MLRATLFATAFVQFVAASANAAVGVQIINKGTPIGPGGVPANGYTGYVLRLTSDGTNITAVDAWDGPDSFGQGGRGLFGPFVQRWTSSPGDGSYDIKSPYGTAKNDTPHVTNFDSHFTVLPDPVLYFGNVYNESLASGSFPPAGNAVPGFPPNTLTAGIGVSGDGFIGSAFGINGPAQSTSIDVAYVVLPDTSPSFDYQMLVATVGGGIFAIQTPEPGMLSIAIPALVTMTARRRGKRRHHLLSPVLGGEEVGFSRGMVNYNPLQARRRRVRIHAAATTKPNPTPAGSGTTFSCTDTNGVPFWVMNSGVPPVILAVAPYVKLVTPVVSGWLAV
jgi:hypothetical protein